MVKGIVFFEEYFNFMDDFTPEQFYKFMGLIRDLRFKGIDTKPEDVEDKEVRLAWRSVRPSVLKSRNNSKDYEKKKQPKEAEQEVSVYTPKEEQLEYVNDELKTELKEVYKMYSSGNKMYELHLNRMKDKYGIPYMKLKEMMDELWETT